MNQKQRVVMFGVVVTLVLGYSFLWINSHFFSYQRQTDKGNKATEMSSQPADEVLGWKTYRDEYSRFQFQYPEKLRLSQEGGSVTLNHALPYENSGACDMMGGAQTYTTLDDFDISFEVVNQKLSLRHIDGRYSAGTLEGSWVYDGAEGCGYNTYYFPLGEDATLVVRRATIQALSGVSTSWDVEKILNIPGVISKEEAEKLFHQILATFVSLQ